MKATFSKETHQLEAVSHVPTLRTATIRTLSYMSRQRGLPSALKRWRTDAVGALVDIMPRIPVFISTTYHAMTHRRFNKEDVISEATEAVHLIRDELILQHIPRHPCFDVLLELVLCYVDQTSEIMCDVS